ncbi:MAG: hypothetical protein ABSE51_05735 [Terracidiphilus sp.]
METIRVPRPPAEAFNKNRRVSDLIRAQVNHLKHIEQKLSAEQRSEIPQHGITTEGEAAQYIGAMTAFLRGQPAADSSRGSQEVPGIRLVASRRPARAKPEEGIDIAAGAETEAATNAHGKAAPKPTSKGSNSADKGSSNSATTDGPSAPKETK